MIILTLTCFLIACSEDVQHEPIEEKEVHESTPITNDEEVEPSLDDQISHEEISETSLIDSEEVFQVQTLSIESPFDAEGNIPNVYTDFEIVDELMDDDGRIYFALDEQPIRSIISSHDENMIHVTNYSDAIIEIVEAQAYTLDEELIEEAYKFFINNPPAELLGTDPNEYRTWEEATNLERALIQSVYLIGPLLNKLSLIVNYELYDHDSLPTLLEELEKIGSPTALIPAPQSLLDYQLYDNIASVQMMWLN